VFSLTLYILPIPLVQYLTLSSMQRPLLVTEEKREKGRALFALPLIAQCTSYNFVSLLSFLVCIIDCSSHPNVNCRFHGTVKCELFFTRKSLLMYSLFKANCYE
jgi:hypothetical protein